MKKKAIIIMGPPTCGKGTQGELIEKENSHFKHISTGQLLRDLGDLSGNFVDDNFIMNLTEKETNKYEKNMIFVLDGIPRTLGQIPLILEKFDILKVIVINIDENEIRKRIEKRENEGSRKDARSIDKRINDYKTLTVPVVRFFKDNNPNLLEEINGNQNIEEIAKEIKNILEEIN
ncbi:MAG: nucleoside monophosphate kinase [Nanoarchaeota archaeon]|nr:nucleoside monophosphate kinase [Nanoarchaeota archaeon]